ncbi:hypothetical protein [Xanthomonas medicagonis]|uniref:hypothetical protein n=1 Tax=Xanthomonas medicagonis TaxID=3160841 RepID=UPI003511456D
MEATQKLQEQLGKIVSYDDFRQACHQVASMAHDTQFQALWSLAILRPDGRAVEMAGYLLAELQPDPDRGLASLMAQIHASGLDASNRFVPFYLVAQFGRRWVVQAASDFIASLPPGAPRSRVDAARYWASIPASQLCKPLHDWEARDLYGIAED